MMKGVSKIEQHLFKSIKGLLTIREEALLLKYQICFFTHADFYRFPITKITSKQFLRKKIDEKKYL